MKLKRIAHVNLKLAAILLAPALFLLGSHAAADDLDADTIKQDIMTFHMSPRAFYGESIHTPPPPPRTSRKKSVATFEEAETAVRKTRSNFPRNSNFEISTDNPFVSRQWKSFDDVKFNKAKLAVQPWSDTYWPVSSGGIGSRYADKHFASIALEDWMKAATYIYKDQNSLVNILTSGDAKNIDNLSPAEKYDLLIGDAYEPVGTRFVDFRWSEGADYFKEFGKVDTWMGICHGWAPASFRVERPTGTVTVVAADGRSLINFYPSDIKALASQMWATSSEGGVTLGDRCTEKKPKKDPKNGRPLNASCLGINPADWHLLNIYQLSLQRDGIIADISTNDEVWNQPVFGYELSYFNPQTGVKSARISDAMISKSEFTADPFSAYRSAAVANIVGVAMKTHYSDETDPSHKKSDSAKDDDVDSIKYYYDLEIDKRGRVIGGEWYKADHPGLAAIEDDGDYPLSTYENSALGDWDRSSPLPPSWIQAANADKKDSQVLSAIVRKLVRWSRSP